MVTATITPDAPTPKSFPKLMISNVGSVVYFTRKERGILVFKGEGTDDKVGDYSTCWDMEFFSDFSGTITLKNS